MLFNREFSVWSILSNDNMVYFKKIVVYYLVDS